MEKKQTNNREDDEEEDDEFGTGITPAYTGNKYNDAKSNRRLNRNPM